MISRKARAVSLPLYRPYDCSIDLVPALMPPRGRLFSLSGPEREAMEVYIPWRQGLLGPLRLLQWWVFSLF